MRSALTVLACLMLASTLSWVSCTYAYAAALPSAGSAWPSLNRAAIAALDAGRYEDALREARRALAVADESYGSDGLQGIEARLRVGAAYAALGEAATARAVLEPATRMAASTYGMGHAATAALAGALAPVLIEQRALTMAEDLLTRVRQAAMQELGPRHPLVGDLTGSMAALYIAKGDPKKARHWLDEDLALSRAIFGEQSAQAATALNNIGVFYLRAYAWPEAAQYFNRAMAIRRSELGPDHPAFAESLHNLAHAEIEMHHPMRAQQLLHSALDIRRATLGVGHRLTEESENLLRIANEQAAQAPAKHYPASGS